MVSTMYVCGTHVEAEVSCDSSSCSQYSSTLLYKRMYALYTTLTSLIVAPESMCYTPRINVFFTPRHFTLPKVATFAVGVSKPGYNHIVHCEGTERHSTIFPY